MTESLNLPQHVKPLWIEGLFTSEYERDTLPLLFAADKVYQDYYTSLRTKNPNLSVAVDQIRERNNLARLERQDGMWMECVDSLSFCVNLRKAVFDESDFQHTAAQKHHIMSLLNFATFFLRESSSGKTREPLLMRSFELFKKAEEAVAHVRGREDRSFLKTAIENNFSVYFAKRKKYCAAAQRMMLAVRAWIPLQIKEHQFYFAVQKSSGDLWSGRVDDAVMGLKQATTLFAKRKLEKAASPARQRTDQEFSDDSDASSSDDDGAGGAGQHIGGGHHESNAPFRYKIHVLNCGLDADMASCIAVHHNLAIALIAQRRYKEAVGWVTKALEIASAQSVLLPAAHPIVIAIRHAEEFCHKMSIGSKMGMFKMKRDEHSAPQYREMQSAVIKARDATHSDEHEGNSPGRSHQRGRSAQPPRFRKPSHVEAIQTYVKNISTRRLVEEYGFEDPRRSKSKSPPKQRDGSSSPPRLRPCSGPQREDQRVQVSDAPAVSVDPSPARESHRSNSPRSSRSSSRRTSPASSRASSPRSDSHSPQRLPSAAATECTTKDGRAAEPVDVATTSVVADAAAGEAPGQPQVVEPKQEEEHVRPPTPAASTEDPPNRSQEVAPEPQSQHPDLGSARDPTPPADVAPNYGEDGFDSASEANSPSKPKQPVDDDEHAPPEKPSSVDPSPPPDPVPSAEGGAPPHPTTSAEEEEEQQRMMDTTYGDDGFESASDVNSPQKSKSKEDPQAAGSGTLDDSRASACQNDGLEASDAASPEKALPAPTASTSEDVTKQTHLDNTAVTDNQNNYTTDFEATADDSAFSPPPPKRESDDAAGTNDEPAPAAAEPPAELDASAVEHAIPPGDTTYGDGDFEDDSSS